MPKPRFTYEQFVLAWDSSNSIQEVQDKLGVGRQTVEKTGTQLRRAGVKLKSMRSGLPLRGEIDVEALNGLIGATTDNGDDDNAQGLDDAVANG